MAFGNGSRLLCCFLLAGCSGETPGQKQDDAGTGGGAVAGTSGSGNGPGTGGASGSSAGSGQSGGSSGAMAGSSTGGSAGAGDGGMGGSAGVPSGGAGGTGNGGAGAGGAAGSAGSTPREESLPDLTTVRQEHAVVALDGEIYVIGGYTPNVTATVEAYDPVARSWRPIRIFLEQLNHANAAAVGNTLYVTGFYVGSSMENASRQVYAYDPMANEWTERASMPDGTQRATGCVAVLGNKIYVFGGGRQRMTVTEASAYDTVANTWEPLPALAESREHCAAGAIDGVIYIASGRTGGITGFRPSTVAFDPTAMMYSQKAPITTPRGGAAGAVLNGRLIVFGGEGNPASGTDGVFPNIEAYDPVTNTWAPLPPMQIPRHGYGAATLDGRIYLAGGATSQGLGAANDSSVFYFE